MSDSLQLKTQFFNYGDDRCHIENSSCGQRFKKHALIQDLVYNKNQRILTEEAKKTHCQLQELNRNKIQNFFNSQSRAEKTRGLTTQLSYSIELCGYCLTMNQVDTG